MGFADDQLSRDKFLGGKLLLRQPIKGYRAGTDPVFLAAACPAKQGETVLDIGCGAGTASLCLAIRTKAIVTGLELQPDYANLARRNAAENGIDMTVYDGDLTAMPPDLNDQSFDHIIMNPPFFGPGKRAQDPGRAIGRQQDVNLSTWIDAGLKRLKPKGWLTIIQLIEELPTIITALNNRAGGLEIKPLTPRQNKNATRALNPKRRIAHDHQFAFDGAETQARRPFSESRGRRTQPRLQHSLYCGTEEAKATFEGRNRTAHSLA